jgi:hypothetical protein
MMYRKKILIVLFLCSIGTILSEEQESQKKATHLVALEAHDQTVETNINAFLAGLVIGALHGECNKLIGKIAFFQKHSCIEATKDISTFLLFNHIEKNIRPSSSDRYLKIGHILGDLLVSSLEVDSAAGTTLRLRVNTLTALEATLHAISLLHTHYTTDTNSVKTSSGNSGMPTLKEERWRKDSEAAARKAKKALLPTKS